MNDLEKGQKYFNLMAQHYGITPALEHYTCMVELYSRVNKLDEIYTLENTNHNVAELLQESKIIGIDDIKELLHKHHRELNCSELVVDHSSSSSPPQLQSFKWDAG